MNPASKTAMRAWPPVPQHLHHRQALRLHDSLVLAKFFKATPPCGPKQVLASVAKDPFCVHWPGAALACTAGAVLRHVSRARWNLWQHRVLLRPQTHATVSGLPLAGVRGWINVSAARSMASTGLAVATESAEQAENATGPTEMERLAKIWNGVTEFMLDVPEVADGGKVVLVPEGEAGHELEHDVMPQALRDHVVFALTAFDPPGVSRTLDENAEENKKLWDDLRKSEGLSTHLAKVWKAFGVHVQEEWREDGFCLAVKADDEAAVNEARSAIVDVARKYKQGAIFEYRPAEENYIVRLTVPVMSDATGEEKLVRARGAGPPLKEPLNRAWAGPSLSTL